MRRSLRALLPLAMVCATFALPATASAAPLTYTVQVDAPAPDGELWDFLKFLPDDGITVHQGDVINSAWAGGGAPHTATFVPSSDVRLWRRQNTGPGDPWEFIIPDTAVGGDEGEPIFNPRVAAPSDFTCGTTDAPCTFDGTSVSNSGIQFGNPGAQPSYAVRVAAPVGQHWLLCLVHPLMESKVNVVARGTRIPSPNAVRGKIREQVYHATTVDGPAADAQAQRLIREPKEAGGNRVIINAGGYVNDVTANEYREAGVTLREGDELVVRGKPEIHTATFPITEADDLRFERLVCEQPGPDEPATSPADCASPQDFHVALNLRAVAPTASNDLDDPQEFVNGGVFAKPGRATFDAVDAGEYSMWCVVHGPGMSTLVRVKPA